MVSSSGLRPPNPRDDNADVGIDGFMIHLKTSSPQSDKGCTLTRERHATALPQTYGHDMSTHMAELSRAGVR